MFNIKTLSLLQVKPLFILLNYIITEHFREHVFSICWGISWQMKAFRVA